jgi:hypothetical protein
MRVREATDADRPGFHRFLSERHSAVVARLGRIENTLEHPALITGIPLRDEIVLEKEVSAWRP